MAPKVYDIDRHDEGQLRLPDRTLFEEIRDGRSMNLSAYLRKISHFYLNLNIEMQVRSPGQAFLF